MIAEMMYVHAVGSLHPKTLDFTINFVIEYHQHPLLLVEVKPLPIGFRKQCRHCPSNITRLDEIGLVEQSARRSIIRRFRS